MTASPNPYDEMSARTADRLHAALGGAALPSASPVHQVAKTPGQFPFRTATSGDAPIVDQVLAGVGSPVDTDPSAEPQEKLTRKQKRAQKAEVRSRSSKKAEKKAAKKARKERERREPFVPTGMLTAQDVHDACFYPTYFATGYDMEQVDLLLDAVEETLTALQSENEELRLRLARYEPETLVL